MDGVLLVAKPAGVTSHDVVESVPPCSAARRSATPARSIRSRPGCWWSWSGAARACSATWSDCRRPTAPWRASARSRTPVIRPGTVTRDRGEDRRAGGACALRAAGRRDRAARAGLLGRQGRRRAALPQGAAWRGGRDAGAPRRDRRARADPVRRGGAGGASSTCAARAAPTCASSSPTSASCAAPARTARSWSARRSGRSCLADADAERLLPLSARGFVPACA